MDFRGILEFVYPHNFQNSSHFMTYMSWIYLWIWLNNSIKLGIVFFNKCLKNSNIIVQRKTLVKDSKFRWPNGIIPYLFASNQKISVKWLLILSQKWKICPVLYLSREKISEILYIL
ncbi:hypothetical protein HZS_2696 [Henneguya salminicola]|nr:hypothetical protein HZS_2696 [Henneguya salminicola]